MVATTRSRSSSSSSNPSKKYHNAPPSLHCLHNDETPEDGDHEESKHNKKDNQVPAPPAAAAAASSPYESVRMQRIAENTARMIALGVQQHAATLTSFFNSTKSKTPRSTTSVAKPKKSPCILLDPYSLRRSQRFKNITPSPGFYALQLPDSSGPKSPKFSKRSLHKLIANTTYRNYQDAELRRPANAPIPKNCPTQLQVSPEFSAYRCRSKERGTLYDAIVGICCHFCRQKKLCGEENCERCGQRDVMKPCLGKTDCSKCHSSTGVFCRACLKIRYGQELEEVRQTSNWLCPHCSEETGLNPFWICNSSICLSKRKIAPTGIAIYKARELGFESVAHYLANVLEKQVTACAA